MDKLILGRYIPGNSIIHRLDPRSKLLAMFLFILLIFWANNLVTNLLLFVFVFSLVLLSKVPLKFFLKGIQSMVFIIAFTTFVPAVFNLWRGHNLSIRFYQNYRTRTVTGWNYF